MSSYKKKEKEQELGEELHKVQHETTKQLSSERERNDHAKKERDETKKIQNMRQLVKNIIITF